MKKSLSLKGYTKALIAAVVAVAALVFMMAGFGVTAKADEPTVTRITGLTYEVVPGSYTETTADQAVAGSSILASQVVVNVAFAVDPSTGDVQYRLYSWDQMSSQHLPMGNTMTISMADLRNQIKGNGQTNFYVLGTILEKPKASAPRADELTVTNASSDTATDGSVAGVDETMEYIEAGDAGASSWYEITGTSIDGLAPGVYAIRYKETTEAWASEYITITVYGPLPEYTVTKLTQNTTSVTAAITSEEDPLCDREEEILRIELAKDGGRTGYFVGAYYEGQGYAVLSVESGALVDRMLVADLAGLKALMDDTHGVWVLGTTTEEEATPAPATPAPSKAPQTGDTANTMLYIVLALIAALGAGAAVSRKRA